MPDLEDRLPQLLADLASEMPSDRNGRTTLVRARRRRFGTAIVGVCVIAILAGGSFAGLEGLRHAQRQTAGGSTVESPAPAPGFRGIWPATTASQLSDAQEQVDAGHTPLLTDPVQTAAMLTTSLFGWAPGDASPAHTRVLGDYALVEETNRMFGDDVPPITIQLEQLGRTGSQGVWTVVSVSTPMIDRLVLAMSTDGRATISGILTQTSSSSSVRVVDLADATDEIASVGLGDVSGGRFTANGLSTETADVNAQVVWVDVRDAAGRTLGATAVPLRDLENGRYPASRPVAIPDVVVATTEKLVQAVGTVDIPTLQLLMDPNRFSYNADDGSNPIVLWKEDPSVLDPIVSILTLPAAGPKQITGYGTFYVWPYLVDSNFANLTAAEVDDLHMLGFDDAAIQQMVKDGRYTGPRLSIDENGLWTSYSTGGNH
jgi:hypothetical protein